MEKEETTTIIFKQKKDGNVKVWKETYTKPSKTYLGITYLNGKKYREYKLSPQQRIKTKTKDYVSDKLLYIEDLKAKYKNSDDWEQLINQDYFVGYDNSLDQIKPKKLNQSILDKVAKKKRYVLQTLLNELGISSIDPSNNSEMVELAKYVSILNLEYKKNIHNKEIETYLDQHCSRILLGVKSKREYFIQYLDRFYWGINQSNISVATYDGILKDNSNRDYLLAEGRTIEPLSMNSVVKLTSLWKDYKKFCQQERLTNRYVLTYREFKQFLESNGCKINRKIHGHYDLYDADGTRWSYEQIRNVTNVVFVSLKY